MDSVERDVIKNSKYIITYYKSQGKLITNLELQKLAYFLEAVYMVCTDEQYLYNEDFSAWNFGPVNLNIYLQYKCFGNLPIELDKDANINPINLKYIEILYKLFSTFNATQLVNLSHIKGSPWYDIYHSSHNGEVSKKEVISKIETKKWFSSLVHKENDK